MLGKAGCGKCDCEGCENGRQSPGILLRARCLPDIMDGRKGGTCRAVVRSAEVLIGNTPRLKFNRLFPNMEIFAKLEHLNPAGSVKDRAGQQHHAALAFLLRNRHAHDPAMGAERPRGLSPYQRGLSPRPHQRARPVSPAASLNGRGLFSPAASFLKLRVL